MTDQSYPQINPELLEILRCPLAMQSDEYGVKAGHLELVKGYWLVCADTNMKYPIRDGIPVMLIEEGKKWQDTPVDQLPTPP